MLFQTQATPRPPTVSPTDDFVEVKQVKQNNVANAVNLPDALRRFKLSEESISNLQIAYNAPASAKSPEQQKMLAAQFLTQLTINLSDKGITYGDYKNFLKDIAMLDVWNATVAQGKATKGGNVASRIDGYGDKTTLNHSQIAELALLTAGLLPTANLPQKQAEDAARRLFSSKSIDELYKNVMGAYQRNMSMQIQQNTKSAAQQEMDFATQTVMSDLSNMDSTYSNIRSGQKDKEEKD